MSDLKNQDDGERDQPMKRKTPKENRKPQQVLISGGFDPDCEMCRLLSEGDPEVFGEPLEVDGVEVREVLDPQRVEDLLRSPNSKQGE